MLLCQGIVHILPSIRMWLPEPIAITQANVHEFWLRTAYNTLMDNLEQHFLLDPNIIFLNHGSFGACPLPVFTAYQQWQRKLEDQPVLFLGREYPHYDHQARQVLADYFHTVADNLVFIPNATYGVNILARSLKLGAGDIVLTTDHEYGACDYTWEYICQTSGAIYRRQPIPLPVYTNPQIVDTLWQAVTPQTKVIYLSHITSPTALCMPVQEICTLARLQGILTVIDGAHAPGQLDLDLPALGADFYTGNCHKWLLSPKGAAFLYSRPEVQQLIEPFVVSWGYHATPETTSGSRFIDLFQWSGTRDPAAALSVPAALEFMHLHHWDNVRDKCHHLLHQAVDRICMLVDIPPLYPLDSSFYIQMGIAPLPPEVNLPQLKSRLYDQFRIEVPLISWNDHKFIRISIQGYNQPADIECLLGALEHLLPFCLY
jgi:isopenicillin-N epimerase